MTPTRLENEEWFGTERSPESKRERAAGHAADAVEKLQGLTETDNADPMTSSHIDTVRAEVEQAAALGTDNAQELQERFSQLEPRARLRLAQNALRRLDSRAEAKEGEDVAPIESFAQWVGSEIKQVSDEAKEKEELEAQFAALVPKAMRRNAEEAILALEEVLQPDSEWAGSSEPSVRSYMAKEALEKAKEAGSADIAELEERYQELDKQVDV